MHTLTESQYGLHDLIDTVQSRVYIREHYPEPIERHRRELQPILREAKQHDRNSYLVKYCLVHKRKRYGVHNVQELLQSFPNKRKNVRVYVKGDLYAFL